MARRAKRLPPSLGMTKIKDPATSRAQTRCMARLPSPAMLMRAPHRLLFFIGASNLLLAMLWWALQVDHLLWLADAPLLMLSLQALWHWWPRGPMPGLLAALFLALAWLPISFALYLLQDIGQMLGHPQLLGRAPLHALAVGLFGSLLVAMVTRVTQGHSGRPLVMPAVAWFAFVALQAVAIMRIAAELMPDAYAWHFAAAIGWLLALAPWVARLGWIYLSPRRDGKPG